MQHWNPWTLLSGASPLARLVSLALMSWLLLLKPSLAADRACVTFDERIYRSSAKVAVGGALSVPPGFPATVRVVPVRLKSGGVASGFVRPSITPGTNNRSLQLVNAGLHVKLNGGARSLSATYADFGGIENLRMDAGPLWVEEIGDWPRLTPRVSVTQTAFRPPAGRGRLHLQGPLSQFVIAGQEFWVDDICIEFGK